MAYDRVKDFEEPLRKVLEDIRQRQEAEAKKFEQLIVSMAKAEITPLKRTSQGFEAVLSGSDKYEIRKGERSYRQENRVSNEKYELMLKFLDKLEELIDVDLLDKHSKV
jgi:hypothetical protein